MSYNDLGVQEDEGESVVADDGSYTAAAGPRLAGLSILGEGGARVEQLLGDSVRHAETITHR